MRLQIIKSKNAASLYIVKSIYENRKRSSKVVERLGTYAELKKKLNGEDPIEWGRKYAAELTLKEKQSKRKILVELEWSSKNGHIFKLPFLNIDFQLFPLVFYNLDMNELC